MQKQWQIAVTHLGENRRKSGRVATGEIMRGAMCLMARDYGAVNLFSFYAGNGMYFAIRSAERENVDTT